MITPRHNGSFGASCTLSVAFGLLLSLSGCGSNGAKSAGSTQNPSGGALGAGGSGTPNAGGVSSVGGFPNGGSTSAGGLSSGASSGGTVNSGGVSGGSSGTTSSGGTSGSSGTGSGPDAGAGATSSAGGSSGASDAGAGGTPSCASLPAVSDYSAPGPFSDATMFTGVGPNNNYTLYRPDSTLGKNGFLHPIATWGNGIDTTPDEYKTTLSLIASHGFVIIACNDTQAERQCLSDGMDWLIAQNAAAGPMQGKLDTKREITIGYSWGGGAAIDTANRPNVKATVSMHGMPPRLDTAFQDMHSPLLLFTSTGDNFVTASQYVTPNFQKSIVQTFYATLDDSTAGHLYVVDPGSAVCIASVLLGDCRGAAAERGPAIAWLRYWVCDDQNARDYFYGDDCKTCQMPFENPQRKDWK